MIFILHNFCCCQVLRNKDIKVVLIFLLLIILCIYVNEYLLIDITDNLKIGFNFF